MALLFSCQLTWAEIAINEPAPGWELKSIEGELVKFPQITQGSPAIILFWASWCPYCKALLPKLAEVKEAFSAKGLEIYAVNFAEADGFTLSKSMRALPFKHFLNGEEVAGRYGADILPAFFIVTGNRIKYIRDYPGKDHPSQNVKSHKKQAALLADWWKQRLTHTLDGIYNNPSKKSETVD